MGIKCPQCHTENSDTSRFCSECGTKLYRKGQIGVSGPTDEISVSCTKTLETPKEELTTGHTFAGRYKVIEELGKGGMGKVYRVIDKKLNEEVALKLIKSEIASDGKTLERFSNELKIARKIVHKNVGRMFDLNEEKGTQYITMEYVPGQDLRGLIRQTGQLTVGKAISITNQVCEGLAEAHKLGVVHRDLKPSNIMIDKEGDARIMDFGIARSLKAKGITGAGVMIGTPEYMSPEQVEAKEVDQRSDIYSLGVILYEMVTGRVPFEGDTALSIAVKHKTEVPVDPREHNAHVPLNLSRFILKCMEKDKEKRFQSVEEVFSELCNIEKGITATERIILKEEPKTTKIEEIEWKNSIAVLPFADLSPQKDQEYFCDGMAEELTNSLTNIKELRVVARTSAFAFKGKDIDIREIGSKLNVETVLEGSVRKAGNRLRITAQLIKIADGYHLWSEKYDREMEDIFAIQDEISVKIAEKLRVELLGAERAKLAKRQPENLEAYNLYLKGRHFYNKGSGEGMNKAIEYYTKAIEIAPDYAQAYSQQAICYMFQGFLNYLHPKDVFPKAKAAALKAIEIDDSLAESHYSLGMIRLVYDWDWDLAERELKLAIELNPNDPQSQWYAMYFNAMGKMAEAIAESDKTLELDPLSTPLFFLRGFYLLRAGLLEKAKGQFQKALELEPNFADAYWLLGHALILDSRYDKGITEIQKALDLSHNNVVILAGLGWGYAVSCRKKEALKVLEELNKRAKQEYIKPFLFAKIYSALGEKDQAFGWLKKAYDDHDVSLALILTDESIENLRSDPRYVALLKKMGLEDKAK